MLAYELVKSWIDKVNSELHLIYKNLDSDGSVDRD